MLKTFRRLKAKPFGMLGIVGCLILLATAAGTVLNVIPQNLIIVLLVLSTIFTFVPTIAQKFRN